MIDGRRVAVEAAFVSTGQDEYGFRVGAYDPSRELIIDPHVVVYATYLGGGLSDTASAIAVDTAGGAYVTGYTESGDFPSSAGGEAATSRYDEFVTKLSPDGQSLVYTVFFGAGRPDEDYWYPSIAVDAAGAAYISGMTNSAKFPGRTNSLDFPVVKPYQKTFGKGDFDAFVAKYSTGSQSARSN